MEKNLISRLSVLVVLIAFATACSRKTEYTHVIPADATAIAAFNLQSLADKAGLNDKANEATKQKMIDALKSGTNATTFQQLEKLIKDPSESGIDLQSPVYVFTATSLPHTTMVAKVNDQQKLRAWIGLMSKEQLCQPIVEAEGYSFTTISDNSLLAFNPTAMFLIDVSGTTPTEEAKKSLTALFQQTATSSLSSNAGFEKMQQQKGDITFLASMGAIPEAYAKQTGMGLPGNVNPRDVMLLGNLNFEKGKASLQFNYYSDNKEVEAMIQKSQKALLKLNNNLLNYFPASTLALFNVGVNGTEFYNLMLENKEFTDNVSIAQADEVKKLFAAVDGDITAGLLNVSLKENATPFLLYADVKSADALKAVYQNKQVLKLGKGEDLLQLGEHEYVYKSRSMNLFFGVRGKQLYATNDELIYKEIGQTPKKSIKSAAYASEMNGKNAFAVINIEAILELPVVKMMVGFGGEEYGMYHKLASQMTYLAMGVDNQGKSEINLVLKNQEVNALKQIVDFAKQFAGM
ncbi:MAG: DUF4836 family protein [Bacteroides sp.]|uniref:DUF4836 family protein n=1 Tax=Bacteroides sp. TaxID=29523 RepID=UPI001B57BC2F|nr:DUF4836 family protein [Bacteroides sp.]MBP6065748.1 DUF4836 family protein [Bacteroides sp.]